MKPAEREPPALASSDRRAAVRMRKHRPEIDGLRSVAILPVLFYHAGLGLHGGFVGVDVFFVISGYLITSLILNAIDDGRFSMVDFWERRIRRIFPPLAVAMVATLVAGWLLFLPRDLKMLGESVAAQALLLSNVLFSLQTGYFAESNEFTALLHTWSLAIEEQFYLCWPLLLFWIARRARSHLGRIVWLLGLLSFGINLYLTAAHPEAAFYLLPGRAWELLLGSCLAIAPPPFLKNGWMKEFCSAAGFAAILAAVFCYGPRTPFPGVAAAVPCLGTALVIWTNSTSLSAVGRLLSLRPLVFIGAISYSLYLWHWPILVYGRYWLENCALIQIAAGHYLGLLALSLPISVLSWKWVETPIRKGWLLKSRSKVFGLAIAMTGVFFASGLAIYLADGFPARVSPEVRRAAEVRKELPLLPNVALTNALRGDFVGLGIGDPSQPVAVLLWGDSNASAAIPVVDALCKAQRVRGAAAVRYLTPPLLDPGDGHGGGLVDPDAAPFNAAVIDYVRTHGIQKVILMAEWNRYLPGDRAAQVEVGLRETIRHLEAAGARIWIVKQVPAQPFDVPTAWGCALRFGRDARRIGLPLPQHEKEAEQQSRIFERCKRPGVEVLDPASCFVNELGFCGAVADDDPLYADKTHLTARGALVLHPLLEPVFQPAQPEEFP